MSAQNLCVLVPGAGFIRDALGRTVHASPLFEIYNGKLVLDLILERLEKCNPKVFIIAVSIRDSNLINYIKILQEKYSCRLEFVIVEGGHNSLKSTLEVLDESMKKFNVDSVLLNLGDTITELPQLESYFWTENFIGVSEVKYSIDRYQELKSEEDASVNKTVASGLYFWKEAKNFSMAVTELDNDKSNDLLDMFQGKFFRRFQSNNWIDIGNTPLQLNAEKVITPARHFNKMEVDIVRGLITKKSKNHEKLKSEFDFLTSLPEKLRYLFPRIIEEYDKSKEGMASFTMEMFSSRSLADYYINGNGFTENWEFIFDRIDQILNIEFANYRSNRITSTDFFFGSRTLHRMQQYLEFCQSRNDDISHFVEKKINWFITNFDKINLHMKNLDNQIDQVMHGDLCFSNILVDEKTLALRLIDPRGGLLDDSIYGSKLYDIAKLCHSVLGKYDLIVRDLYSLREKNGIWELTLPETQQQLAVTKSFSRFLLRNSLSSELGEILGGLVLISIPTFHSDNPKRAAALFIKGFSLIEKNI